MSLRNYVQKHKILCVSIAVIALLLTAAYLILAQINLIFTQERIVSLLKVYSAYDENGALKLVRHGKENDGGYIAPLKALEASDALLGYGIAEDNSFEENFSESYSKPSYGFDCGIKSFPSKNKFFTFINECIGNDQFLYQEHTSSGKITSFKDHIDKLNLHGKKLFIKMDIEGAEYDAFEGIIPYVHDINAIVLELHFGDLSNNLKAIKLLSDLQEQFLLLHIHGNNCCLYSAFSATNLIGKLPPVIELTYINKSLASDYKIAENQSYPTELDMPNIKGFRDAKFKIIR